MALSSIKASTQDATGGTPVAIVLNEEDSTKAIQASSFVGAKETWSHLQRTGLTGADTSTTDLSTSGFAGSAGANLLELGNATSVKVRATCSSASAVLTGRLVWYDSSNNPLSVSETLTFQSDSALRLSASGDYIAQRQMVDVASARKCRFYVDSVSAGTWSVTIRPYS